MQKANGHVLFMPHFAIIYSCSCSLQNDSPVILASLIKRREVQWLRGGNHSAELSAVAARLARMDAALWRGAEQLSGALCAFRVCAGEGRDNCFSWKPKVLSVAASCLIAGLHSKCVCWKGAEIPAARQRLSTLLILRRLWEGSPGKPEM